jgi:hypothetical protein
MNPIVPKPVNPEWQQFWEKVKEDPDYFDEEFDTFVSDIEDEIPEVYSDDEFEKPAVPKEIEEDIEVEDI